MSPSDQQPRRRITRHYARAFLFSVRTGSPLARLHVITKAMLVLGVSALGIRNMLCLSGDHQLFGNHPEAKNVYDLDSMQLIALVKKMRDFNLAKMSQWAIHHQIDPASFTKVSAEDLDKVLGKMRTAARKGNADAACVTGRRWLC